MKITTIHQPMYFPYVGVLAKIKMADNYVIYDSADFPKGYFVSRNRIMSKNGPIWLTIPVHSHLRQSIRDVTIAGSNWIHKHLNAIRQSYSKSPFFDKYFPTLSLALQLRSKWLIDYLVSTLVWLFSILNINPTIYFSSQLLKNDDLSVDEKLAYMTDKSGGDCYLAGPSWVNYIDNLDSFKNMEIKFYESLINCQPYAAINGFEPNMSVLDLLFSNSQPLEHLNKSIKIQNVPTL